MAARISAVVRAMVVMLAMRIGVVSKTAGEKRLYGGIRIAAYAAVYANTGFRQSLLRSAADAAADQRVHAQRPQKRCQRAMSVAVGGNKLPFPHGIALHRIDGKLLRVAKVLKDLPVFIRCCNLHHNRSFLRSKYFL